MNGGTIENNFVGRDTDASTYARAGIFASRAQVNILGGTITGNFGLAQQFSDERISALGIFMRSTASAPATCTITPENAIEIDGSTGATGTGSNYLYYTVLPSDPATSGTLTIGGSEITDWTPYSTASLNLAALSFVPTTTGGGGGFPADFDAIAGYGGIITGGGILCSN
jgi:hypothetical protein